MTEPGDKNGANGPEPVRRAPMDPGGLYAVAANTSANQVLDALDLIYQAALAPKVWPDALQKIANCFDDVGAALFFQRDDGITGNIVSPGIMVAQAEYNRDWWDKDIRQRRYAERGFLARLDAITDRHLVSREEIETDPIYTQFNPKHGLGWVAAITVLPDPRWPVWLSVQRSSSKPQFRDEELETLVRLGRHTENALRLGLRLISAEAVASNTMDILGRMDCGVVVLDGAKRLLFQNIAAERALSNNPYLQTAIREQVSRTAANSAAARGRKPSKSSSLSKEDPLPIIVDRPDRRPLVFYFLPVRLSETKPPAALFLDARTIAVILDLDVHRTLDPSLLRAVLGLTLAEARVAALVGAGYTLKDAAVSLGVREQTVRQVLKGVFAKTGINRQTDLALLMSRLSFV